MFVAWNFIEHVFNFNIAGGNLLFGISVCLRGFLCCVF